MVKNMFAYYFSVFGEEDNRLYEYNEIDVLIDDIYDSFVFDCTTIKEPYDLIINIFRNDKDKLHLVIPNFGCEFEDYTPESWFEYCHRVNAQFYLRDSGLEDYDGHIDTYEDNEEFKAEGFRKKLHNLIVGRIQESNKENFMIDFPRKRSDYDSDVILIRDLSNNTCEEVKLKFDFTAINDAGNGNNSYLFRIRNDYTYDNFYIHKSTYNQEEVELIKKNFKYKQEPLCVEVDKPTMYIVDVDAIGSGFRFYFGTKDQFIKSYGDDWDDAPYNCNAGTVYEEYVSKTWDWVPEKNLIVEPIEEALHIGFNPAIDKYMMKRRIVPAIVISKETNDYDRKHLNEYPVFFGMTDIELLEILDRIK